MVNELERKIGASVVSRRMEGREEGRKEGKKEGREGRRKEGKKKGREEEKEGRRKGGREEEREEGRKKGKEGCKNLPFPLLLQTLSSFLSRKDYFLSRRKRHTMHYNSHLAFIRRNKFLK